MIQTVEAARKFLRRVSEIADEYNANFFIVTDGASLTRNNNNPAVENARVAHAEWEVENGLDPDERWFL